MTKSNLILCIETTTEVCSTALAENGKCLAELTVNEPNAHGSKLTLLIEKLFEQTAYSINDLDAVAYSSGPGSYTGLRIGLSTAKGICFGNNIPLINIPTLEHMTAKAIQMNNESEVYMPMLDARRMEVYTAVINKDLEILTQPFACLLEEFDWNTLEKFSSIAYFGNGSNKAVKVLADRSNFSQINNFQLDASSLCPLAYKKYTSSAYADLALHVPFYLKGAHITTSKKTTL